jgi:hypothetical protein
MFKTLVKIVLLLDDLFFEGFSFELQFLFAFIHGFHFFL